MHEPFENVTEFVKENLSVDVPFSLLRAEGKKFEDGDKVKQLLDLQLVPKAVLNFHPENSDEEVFSYLKPDLLMLMKTL